MSHWPRNIECCVNCTGDASSYTYGARGYCNRCYRILIHIAQVQAWDRTHRETLKGSTRLLTDIYADDEFEICRAEHIRQLTRRLTVLRHREEIRRHEVEVSPLDLEYQFAELLRLIRRKSQYPRNASYLNTHFNENERRVIYGLSEEIIEQAPWRGIQWYPIVNAVSKHRQKAEINRK